MSNFNFGNISTSSRKSALNLKGIQDVVLMDKSNYSASYDFVVTILADEAYSQFQVRAIDNMLKKAGITKYIMLSTLNCKITKEEIVRSQKGGVIRFYKTHRSDYENYIPQYSPIITVGGALYSHLREDDIYPNHVQQRVFGKTNFWFSYTLKREDGHYIYPIDSFRDIFADGFIEPVDSFRTKLAYAQFRDVVTHGNKPAPRYPNLIKHFITSEEEFDRVFYEPNKDKRNQLLAWDLETSGLSFIKDRIGCITLSYDGIEGWYIPWKYVNKEKLDFILGNSIQVGANLKFDVKFLKYNGLKNARVDEDVLIMAHCLDETRSNGLKAMAFFYSEFGGYERALDNYKAKLRKGFDINYIEDIDEDVLKEYAIMDAIVTMRVYKNMLAHLRELDRLYPNEKFPSNSLETYYSYRRIPAVNMYEKLEYDGVYVNTEKLSIVRKAIAAHIEELKDILAKEFNVPREFNWGSPYVVGKLFKNMGWESYGTNSKGEYSVADFQLERWVKKHPEVAYLQELRSMNVLLRTFVGDVEGTTGWTQYLIHHDEDPANVSRLHPTFAAMGTESGRTRTSQPNTQNIPTRGLFTKEIKGCLCTPDDDKYYMVTLDYSALQLRLATIDCGDKNLTKVFTMPGADAHSMTAWNTFCQDKEYKLDIITVEQDGKTREYFAGENVLTQRGEVAASELTEEDTIINF